MLPSFELKRGILAAGVVWCGFSLLAALHGSVSRYDLRNDRPTAPALWRLGTRAPARLQGCLAEVERRIPKTATVSVLSLPGPAEAEFYRWRWAAYLLPEHDVVLEDPPRLGYPRDYVVALQRKAEGEGLKLIYEHPGCRLYRAGVEAPAAPATTPPERRPAP
jgi:hypothetical protein